LAKVAVDQKKSQTVKQRNKLLKIAAIAVVVVGLVIGVNRCSSSDDATVDTTVGSSSSVAAAPTTTVPKFASAKLTTKPVITVPAGVAPTKLEIKDLEVGGGATVEVGDTVFVQYAGNSWSTKLEFDSSWSRGAEPFEVVGLGNAPVIAGWNQGLIGMKVGGRRQLIIPPDLAYGAEARGDSIKANDTLVFVVDVVRVIKAADVVSNTPTIAQ